MASSDDAMSVNPSENIEETKYLQHILSEEELKLIPNEVACKIETYYNAKLGELFTSNALSEAGRREASEKVEKIEEELKDASSKYEEYKCKFESSEETLKDLQSQLAVAKEQLTQTTNLLRKAEQDLIDLKNDRCSAVDERDSLSGMLERREREIDRLKSELTTLTNQLEQTVNDKCKAMSRIGEIESKEFTLTFKEQHMEQEKALLKSQIKGLNDDLMRTNEEMKTMRFTLSQKILHLDAQLVEKSEECKMSQDTINNLNHVNKTLRSKNEALIQKLSDQYDVEKNMNRNYRDEIEEKTKIADLYKSMQMDSENKSVELANGVTELQRLLNESVDKYGELETKCKQIESDYEDMLERKNSTIADLKKEINNANELLQGAKNSSVSQVLEKISPLGAVAGRILHANMTMTQLYTQLTDVADELLKEKEENKRITEVLTNVYSELREKAPMFNELQHRYEEAIEVNATLSRQLEEVVAENNGLTDELKQMMRRSTHLQRENDKIKKEVEDLGRQVCYLLREIEMSKGGFIPNGDKDADVQSESFNSSELITKHLVTFGDIQEIQNNNQKLLRTIRELTEKQEEKEKQQNELDSTEMQKKYEALEIKTKEMVDERNKMAKMVENLVKQRDMYKKQCNSSSGKKGETSFETSDLSEKLNKSYNESALEDETHKKQLSDIKAQLDKTSEEYRTYRVESQANQKLYVKQIEEMRKEINEVTSAYSKAATQLEFLHEKQNTLQLNITTYKKQIASLEQQNKNYSVTIAKNEQSMMSLRQETVNLMNKQAKSEAQVQSLSKEVQHLRIIESKLTTERDFLAKEKQNQGLVLNNLEMIKLSLAKAEQDSRVTLESRLDDANREIIAMRRTLHEEQTRFRELTSLLEKSKEEAVHKMEDEKREADKLRHELRILHEELKNNSGIIGDINKKYQSDASLLDSHVDLVKKVKEYESQLNSKQAELKYLQQQIEISQQRVEQYRDISQEAERQLQIINSQYEELKSSSESRIKCLELSESELKERCSELEAELSIQTDGKHISNAQLKAELSKYTQKLEDLQKEMHYKDVSLQEAQAEALRLSASTEQAEEKYSQEVILHSNDIQALAQCKEKLAALEQDFAQLQVAKLEAIDSLNENKLAWEKQESALNAEKEELCSRFSDLNKQNSLLLDQIQVLSTKLSLATVSKQSDNLNQSMNTSFSGDSSFNRSLNEDEVKSSEKLVQIIKFLRKERDIMVTRYDILQTDHIKLKSLLDVTNKNLDEAKLSLASEQQKAAENSMMSNKHSELLRKVEQFNAISDSNRALREDKEALIVKINHLTEAMSKLEEALAPLQEKNQELTRKLDAQQSENSSLKTELGRWRKRVTDLVESISRTSSEDWKKLQNEKDSLMKVLASEREVIKKLNEECAAIKTDKIKLEEHINNLNKQHIIQTEQYKKQTEEITSVKKDLARINQELEQTKASLTEKTTDINKLTESNSEKEATIADLKNKETQIRKIAKKYKAQFEELTKTVEESKNKKEEENAETEETSDINNIKKEYDDRISDMEKSFAEKISELETKITESLQENNRLKTETEALITASNDKEEKAKLLLKQAKQKIVNLTESNEKFANQLAEAETAVQNKEENDTRFELLTSQYEARMNKAEKEKNESIAEKQQEIQRLRLEIEGLNVRISQLIRERGRESERVVSVSETGATPTANIKPMAAHSATMQGSVGSRRGETPFASIRPMASTATRTAAVLPSPSSSGHSTEYMPASSSARPRPTAPDSPPHPPQALVSPRVEEGPGPVSAPPRPSLKRKPQHSHKTSQQMKRSKTVQQGQVSESHCETEYQVPTSSQRDHEDDGVILVDSEDEGDEDEGVFYQEGDEDEDVDEEMEEEEDVDDEEGVEEEEEVREEEDGEEGEEPEEVEGEGEEEDDEEDREEEGGMRDEDSAEEEEEEQDEAEPRDGEHQEFPAQSECEVGESSEVAPPEAPPTTSSPTPDTGTQD